MADLMRTALDVHQAIYERSGGLLGHRLFLGMPSLLLRTTGRRTGKTRTAALIYARDGENYLVTASNGGAPKPPAWFLNLTAHPQCEIQVGRTKHAVTASPMLPEDTDYARMWDLVNKVNHNQYREYQKKTSRPIPIVVLSPRG